MSAAISGARRALRRARLGPRAWTLIAVAALAALELGLRTLGGFGRQLLTESNARLGWRMLPDQSVPSSFGGVVERINARGYRDRDWEDPAADGAGATRRDERLFRIALLGNSVTYGLGVDIERTWGRLLEALAQDALLRRGDGRRALSMNFAVPGYVVEQMVRAFEDDARPFLPDAVILALSPYDVRRMVRAQDAPRYPLRTWLVRTATYDAFVHRVLRGRGLLLAAPPDEEARAENLAGFLRVRRDPFAPVNAPRWEEALASLERLRTLVEQDGARLVIVSLPMAGCLFEAEREWTPERLEPWLALHPDVAHVDPRPAFREACRELLVEARARGVSLRELWSLEDPVQARPKGPELLSLVSELPGGPFLARDPMHLTELGHAALAAEVNAALWDSPDDAAPRPPEERP